MSLSKFIVQFCYELEDSIHYKRSKQFFSGIFVTTLAL